MRAIEIYVTYEKGAADVIRELGYPDHKTLRVGRAPRWSRDEFSSRNGGGGGPSRTWRSGYAWPCSPTRVCGGWPDECELASKI